MSTAAGNGAVAFRTTVLLGGKTATTRERRIATSVTALHEGRK